MAADTFWFCSVHATASCARDSPASSASGRSRCTAASVSSLSQRLMKPEPAGAEARESAGGAAPGRYFPVSTPCAIGERRSAPMPSFSHVGTTSGSITRHSMVYSGWFDTIRS